MVIVNERRLNGAQRDIPSEWPSCRLSIGDKDWFPGTVELVSPFGSSSTGTMPSSPDISVNVPFGFIVEDLANTVSVGEQKRNRICD